jgi:cytochrome c2/cytochrome b561
MNSPSGAPRSETLWSRRAGWAFAIAFTLHTLLLAVLPRLDKESSIREVARGWHYLIGLSLLALALWRLWLWYRDRGAIPAGALPPLLRFWHQALALATLALVVLAGPLGFTYGWGEGRTIHLAGAMTIPALMERDHAVWQFSGYFHSALSNASVFVAMLAVLSGAYSLARYGKGLIASFPAGFGFLFLAKSAVFIYAVNSFRERTPGFIAAGVFLAIVLAYWIGVSRFGRPKPVPAGPGNAGIVPIAASLAVLAAVIGYGLYMPYAMFRVTPFASGIKVAADPGITWHRERAASVVIAPPTPFEQQVAAQTYKWCRFCHTVKAGDAHLLGPNLHNIFGQRAGTVPNFYYSPAMAAAGRQGLVWSEETVARYIAGPDAFVPGTSMIISSGPVTDPKVQAAIVNLLKRDTMIP